MTKAEAFKLAYAQWEAALDAWVKSSEETARLAKLRDEAMERRQKAAIDLIAEAEPKAYAKLKVEWVK